MVSVGEREMHVDDIRASFEANGVCFPSTNLGWGNADAGATVVKDDKEEEADEVDDSSQKKPKKVAEIERSDRGQGSCCSEFSGKLLCAECAHESERVVASVFD